MDNKELVAVISKIVDMADKKNGVTDVAVGGSLRSGLETTVRLGEVESVEFNREKSVEIMVYKGQRKGVVSITDLSDEALTSAIDAASRIADYTEEDQYAGLADRELLAWDVEDLDLQHPAGIKAEGAIQRAKECEAAALAYDKKISNSEGGVFGTTEAFHIYANSNGFFGSYPSTTYSAHCIVIAQQSDQMERDYEYTIARDLADLQSMKSVGISAAEKTIARLGAQKISTRKAPVILVPSLAKKFWGTLVAAISGGNLYRQRSFLLDCLRDTIFPEFINLDEQPHLLKALGSSPFDSEGVATYDKPIIEAGVLSTYLLSSYSGRRLGMRSTANAGGVHNLCVEPGDLSYEKLVAKMGTGLIVTELMGQGTNLVTGDYSQGARGFWVENGKIQYPVHEITIANNFKDMFKNVIAVGNDLDHRGNIITGSVLLDEMMIAGS